MSTFRRQVLVKVFVLFDLGVLAFCYAIVAVWRLGGRYSFTSLVNIQVKVLDIAFALALFAAWHFIFSSFGLYQSKRLGRQETEAADVFKATGTSSLVLALGLGACRMQLITLPAICGFWVLSSLVLVASRISMRAVLARFRKHGRNLRHVLIVGTNPRAIQFAHTIAGRPELGYKLIGFADEPWEGNRVFAKEPYRIVAGLDDFADVLRKRIVDEVIVALPMKSFYSTAASIVAKCQEQGVTVRTLTNIFDSQQHDLSSGELGAVGVATYSTGVFEGWPLVFKRAFDIIVSLSLLIIFAPVFIIVAILIKADSSGSIFFGQERIGLNKRHFKIYKFRTMVADAERQQGQLERLNEVAGPVFKIRNDPRITRVGRFLRKTSLDELPQLLNVFRGDMSLVGPRPLPIRDFKGFDQDWARRRFSVRPGITCLWQVNGRSSISFHDWMKLDLHYIDNWSFWLDVKVLAKTIPAVLKGVGAV